MERWSHLKIDSGSYIIKIDQNIASNSEPLFTFWLSDFKTLWRDTIFSKEDINNRISGNNPSMIINDKITDESIATIRKVEHLLCANTNIDMNGDEIYLQLIYAADDELSINFKWILKKCEPHQFFNEITKALLQQITELQKHKEQLIDVAKRKDDEIRQYKLQGAPELMRKRFITEEFKADKFTPMSEMLSLQLIKDLDSLIGPLPLPKIDIDLGETNEETTLMEQNIEAKTNYSPRSKKRNQRRHRHEFVRLGVVYDDDDDSESTPNETTNLSKRTRQSSDF